MFYKLDFLMTAIRKTTLQVAYFQFFYKPNHGIIYF